MPSLIGAPILRLEDGLLLTGKARFVDDIAVPALLHAAFVRSPHPHAAIGNIDGSAARALSGVYAVLTLDDLAPVLAQRRMLRHSNSGTPLDRYWSFALADGEAFAELEDDILRGRPGLPIGRDEGRPAEEKAVVIDPALGP